MSEPPAPLQFTADRGDASLRLDQVLVRRVTTVSRMSRNLAQGWIEAGLVTVDGRVVERSSSGVRESALVVVAVPVDTVFRERPGPEAGDLDVLYEDDALLVVNKPPGMVVHPSYKQHHGTLLGRVLWRLRERADAAPGILTRLDKDTSGLVVLGVTPGVHAALQRASTAGAVLKQYLAIVRGAPEPASGHIDAPLGRDPEDRRRVIVTPTGAPCETRYEVLTVHGDTSLVRCELVTGRTHQIRVHLASRGWPIVGDRVYGVADERIDRQALHAWRIELPHPATGARLVIEAPLPTDMAAIVDGQAPAALHTRSG